MLPSQTLPDCQQHLLSRELVPQKNVTFYAYWANRYLTFLKRLKNAKPERRNDHDLYPCHTGHDDSTEKPP